MLLLLITFTDYGLLKKAVSSSDYVMSNDRMNSE